MNKNKFGSVNYLVYFYQMEANEFFEELYDKYGYYVDDNLFAMEMVTGRSVVMQNDFMKALKEAYELGRSDANDENYAQNEANSNE